MQKSPDLQEENTDCPHVLSKVAQSFIRIKSPLTAKCNISGYLAIALGVKSWELAERRSNEKDQKQWDLLRKDSCSVLEKSARLLCSYACVDFSVPLSISNVVHIQSYLKGYQIFILDGSSEDFKPKFIGPLADKEIYLLFSNDHYDLVTKIHSLYQRSYWCKFCWKGSKELSKHNCINTCKFCRQPKCCELEGTKKQVMCTKCKRLFNGFSCYKLHQQSKLCRKFQRNSRLCTYIQI